MDVLRPAAQRAEGAEQALGKAKARLQALQDVKEQLVKEQARLFFGLAWLGLAWLGGGQRHGHHACGGFGGTEMACVHAFADMPSVVLSSTYCHAQAAHQEALETALKHERELQQLPALKRQLDALKTHATETELEMRCALLFFVLLVSV